MAAYAKAMAAIYRHTAFVGDVALIGCYISQGSLKLQVSFAKEPYKRDNILQKRPIIALI